MPVDIKRWKKNTILIFGVLMLIFFILVFIIFVISEIYALTG
ncbi:hypothetical protein Metok_0316 [Methanothermococcus okinawensis IH1]|uniref:Uncharacterized protein n=1 Tax=Methanothermococcus okinawensis (strain DSM 14208 / JCM 11175 / IH1) TaxID=647113 RepID=F8AKA6_METOI|nr:hypothetical protein Metok_0316 [Methanothermococcus okinawensis IH1]